MTSDLDLAIDYSSATFPPPRDFQAKANDAIRDGRRAGHKNQLLVAPTGAGKTYLGLQFCQQALAKGRRATFLCDRITLIDQTSAAANKYGLIHHGIIQASNPKYNPNLPLQIASAMTVASRGWHETDLIVVDEAHTQLGAWVDHINKTQATVVGLSATPFSKGLGRLFTNLVNAATMHELVQSGVLVPFRAFVGKAPDMRGATVNNKGEWTESSVEERGAKIIGDVVSSWAELAEGRKTICFASSIKHCEEICHQFNQAGIQAAMFTSKTRDAERIKLRREFDKPDSLIRVLVSVEALAKGFDVPDVGCVIDCRPLRKSLSTYIQMIGRGARSHPGKLDYILLDHSGNLERFQDDFVDFYFDGVDTLNDGEILDSKIRGKEDEGGEEIPPLMKCPSCGFTPFYKRCMSCGHQAAVKPTVEHAPGVMTEFTLSRKGTELYNNERLYRELRAYAMKHSPPDPERQRKRAGMLFKKTTGFWPPQSLESMQIPPGTAYTKDIYNLVKRHDIAWYNSKRA